MHAATPTGTPRTRASRNRMYFASIREISWTRDRGGYILHHGCGVNPEENSGPNSGTIAWTRIQPKRPQYRWSFSGFRFNNVTFGEATTGFARALHRGAPAISPRPIWTSSCSVARSGNAAHPARGRPRHRGRDAIVRLSRWFGPPLNERVTAAISCDAGAHGPGGSRKPFFCSAAPRGWPKGGRGVAAS
jgi:hypothetical protein